MQFEERFFQTQFFVFTDRIYEWNIDGFSKQEIINKMAHMSMVRIAYVNNHNLDHHEIVDLLVIGFSGTLRGWWDSYLPKDSKESIKHAVKKNDESFPIFDESIGKGIPDGVNTLIYTIFKHFVGTPSNISSQISDYILHYCLLGWFYFAYFIFNIILLCFRLQRCVPSPFMVSKPD